MFESHLNYVLEMAWNPVTIIYREVVILRHLAKRTALTSR
jgi:hypothetical protein